MNMTRPGNILDAHGKLSATVSLLYGKGVGDSHLARLRKEDQKPYLDAVSKVMVEYGGILELPATEQAILDHLGASSYFGLRDWSRCFWVLPTEEELASFPALQWPIEFFDGPCTVNPGKKIKDTHFLYLGRKEAHGAIGTTLTLWTWEKLLSEAYHKDIVLPPLKKVDNLASVPKSPFCHDECSFEWHLILKKPFRHKDASSIEELLQCIPENYQLQSAVTSGTGQFLFYAKHRSFIAGFPYSLPYQPKRLSFINQDLHHNGRQLAITQVFENEKRRWDIGPSPDDIQNCGLSLARIPDK